MLIIRLTKVIVLNRKRERRSKQEQLKNNGIFRIKEYKARKCSKWPKEDKRGKWGLDDNAIKRNDWPY